MAEVRASRDLITWQTIDVYKRQVRDWGDTDKHVKAVQEYHYEIVGNYYSTLFQDA